MLLDYKRGQGSIILRVKILNSSVSTGAGLTGLAHDSAGLIISAIADNEATATAYTQAGGTIETIATLGTYAAPTATKCRFKEVDSTNHKGICEIQIADARYAVSGAKSLVISISGATNCAECDAVIPLRDVDPYDLSAVQQKAAQIEEGTNGVVWHVARAEHGGAGANDGKSWATPMLTVSAAVALAAAGDVIRVGRGDFNETVDSSAVADLRVCGVPGSTRIYESIDYDESPYTIWKFGNGLTLHGLTIQNTAVLGGDTLSDNNTARSDLTIAKCSLLNDATNSDGAAALRVIEPQRLRITNSYIDGAEYGISLEGNLADVKQHVWIENSDIVTSGWTTCSTIALGIYGTNDVILRNVRINGVQTTGNQEELATQGLYVAYCDRVNIDGGSIQAAPADGNYGRAVMAHDSNVHLRGVMLQTPDGTACYDFHLAGSAAVTVDHVQYNTDKTSVTSSTLTNLTDLAAQTAWNTASPGSPTAGSPYDELDAIKTKTGYALTEAERNAIADAYLNRENGIETGVTPKQAQQRIGAGVAGNLSGAGSGTEILLGLDGLTTRITVSADAAGNRTMVYS